MMHKLIGLSVLFAAASAHAQPAPAGLPPMPSTEPLGMTTQAEPLAMTPARDETQNEAQDEARHQRNVGIGMTIGGALGLGVGLALTIPNWNPKLGDPGFVPAVVGAWVTVLSVPAVTVGPYLWVSGNRRMRATQEGFVPVAATPYVAPIQGGGAVAGIQCATW